MKNRMNRFLYLPGAMLLLLPFAGNSQGNSDFAKQKPKLEALYQLPHMKEWYTERIIPPPFDYNIDLSGKTYSELRILRNLVFARNGYLFNDAALRGYFNQFKWYQPVFDVPEYQVELSKEEQLFVDKVLKLESEKLMQKYVQPGENLLVNMEHVVNLDQFKEVNGQLYNALSQKNFALASAKNEQLFYVYDKNQYQYIPNFITTDLYLQVLHKYLSSLMQEIEMTKMAPIVENMLTLLYQESKKFKGVKNKEFNSAAKWANAYCAIGLSAISGTELMVDAPMDIFYREEIEKVTQGSGMNSTFLKRKIFDYTPFIPRGNYTANDTLKRYFRCVKWLNSASMNISDQDRFNGALLMAFWIKSNPVCMNDFNVFNGVASAFSGDEDNYSIAHLIKILEENKISTIEQLTQKKTPVKVKQALLQLKGIDRVAPKAANDLAKEVFTEKALLFSAGRYTFDAEILSRLVHVLRPDPKRTFPKALDVFAVLGNKTAEEILLNEYRESEKWPAYTDSLNLLKKHLGHSCNWDKSIFNKTFWCFNRLNDQAEAAYPLFMKTDAWKKKNLYTSLAAYTQLKHDLVLYSEQPWAAEAGEGGGPPPPQHVSYVEPNTHFWYSAIELLDFQEKLFGSMELLSDGKREIAEELKDLAQFLLSVSQKELDKKNVSSDEFDRMTWLGGEIERLTFRIMDTDHLPEREKKIALATDIYTYNKEVLEEAVGYADEIYVIAEINGHAYLTKGACFSYYEFKSTTRLTDEKWQEVIDSVKVPMYPKWIQPLYIETKSLESKPGYSF